MPPSPKSQWAFNPALPTRGKRLQSGAAGHAAHSLPDTILTGRFWVISPRRSRRRYRGGNAGRVHYITFFLLDTELNMSSMLP